MTKAAARRSEGRGAARVAVSAAPPDAPLPPSLRIRVRQPAREEPRRLCVVLPGHSMTACDMADWWDSTDVAARFPHMEVVFLQAPTRWCAASSLFVPSWFDYLGDFGGACEDPVSLPALAATLEGLARTIAKLSSDMGADGTSAVALVGLSEGGCVALELGCRLRFACVVTLVAYRRSESASAPLLSPWFALVAAHDAIFARPWATSCLAGAAWKISVDDDHYLHSAVPEVGTFLASALRAEI